MLHLSELVSSQPNSPMANKYVVAEWKNVKHNFDNYLEDIASMLELEMQMSWQA